MGKGGGGVDENLHPPLPMWKAGPDKYQCYLINI